MASTCSEVTMSKIGILELIGGRPKERRRVLREIDQLRQEIDPNDLGKGVVTKTIEIYSPIDGQTERPVEFHNNHVRCGITRNFICRT